MKRTIDLESILASLKGENPAGENLQYTLHGEIQEARREDDVLDKGDWKHHLKKADWEKVISLCTEALSKQSKDLQIAVWLTEALTVTDGFEGFGTGLTIIRGLLEQFWDHLYPEIEDGDLDYRAGRLEFLNNNLWSRIKSIPVTDSSAKAGFSWIQWEESRRVGYEGDAGQKDIRNALIAEGKITGEEFDTAVSYSSKDFYSNLTENLMICRQEFERLDQIVDEKFGDNSPRLAELRTALEDCDTLIGKILKEKKALEPDEPEPGSNPNISAEEQHHFENNAQTQLITEKETTMALTPGSRDLNVDSSSNEIAIWRNALDLLNTSGFNSALNTLLAASASSPSVREKNRFRLLMAKLCLKAERPDLARPIVEELNALIEELNLERWESPKWVAEVLDALYKCLTAGEPSSENLGRSEQLFQKLCTLDVTKAILYKH